MACACAKAPKNKPGLTQMLYESLASRNKQIANDNTQILLRMIRVFREEKHLSVSDQQFVANCEAILGKTEVVLDSLRQARLRLRRYAVRENGHDATDMMLGSNKQGPAYRLLKLINEYSAAMCRQEKYLKPIVLLPAMEGRDNIDAVARFYFDNASIPEAFAGLSHIESKILEYQAEIAHMQAARVTIEDVTFDAVSAFASAQSNIVAAGDTYRAQLLLTTALPQVKQTMTVNGRTIEVVDGRGNVEFVADGKGLEQQDSIRKSWLGAIRFRWQGTDTTWSVRVPYMVVRKRK